MKYARQLHELLGLKPGNSGTMNTLQKAYVQWTAVGWW